MSLEVSLRRKTLVDGDKVLLGNGEWWQIPQAAYLPRSRYFFKDTVTSPVAPSWWKRLLGVPVGTKREERIRSKPGFQSKKHARLIALVFQVYDQDDGPITGFDISDEEAAEACFLALEVNYRVTLDVVNQARLITDANIADVICAVLGFQKKPSTRDVVDLAFKLNDIDASKLTPSEAKRVAAWLIRSGRAPSVPEVFDIEPDYTTAEDVVGDIPIEEEAA